MSDSSFDAMQLTHEAAIVQVVEGRTPTDAKLLRLSDWLNPILVKETRQALKSQQFVWTFILMMLAVVGWTIAGVTLMTPGIYFLPAGPSLLFGYFLILLVPVIVVIPMSAFRSMSSELEDGTHDILSLSSLTSRQIVIGKLLVAVLQAIVFFSAVTPCICLTYLLRGVGIDYILVMVSGTFAISVLASMIAILFATLAKTRERQVLMTLCLFLVLVPTLFGWVGFCGSMMRETFPFDRPEFWWSLLGVSAIVASYLWLTILVAAAKIGIVTENHSTRIRRWLLVPHFFWLWFAVSIEILAAPEGRHWVFFLSIIGLHWFIAGVVMIGENGQITPRARRGLPASGTGRLLFSWFNPGGGPGYVFGIASMASVILSLWLVIQFSPNTVVGWRWPVFDFATAITAYLALYLGAARLLVLGLGKFVRARMLTIVATLFLLLVLGMAGPMSVSFWRNNFTMIDYEFYSFPHFPWTLSLLVNNDSKAMLGLQWLVVSATLLFTANLLFVTRDVMLIRLAVPTDVLKETRPELVASTEVLDPLAPDS